MTSKFPGRPGSILQTFLEIVSLFRLPTKVTKCSLSELASSFADEIADIITEKQSKGAHFVKGSISITEVDDVAFKPEVTLYFTTREDSGFVVKSDSTIQTMSSYLTEDAIRELRSNHEVLFDVRASA